MRSSRSRSCNRRARVVVSSATCGEEGRLFEGDPSERSRVVEDGEAIVPGLNGRSLVVVFIYGGKSKSGGMSKRCCCPAKKS
jgi:hypothetical protein